MIPVIQISLDGQDISGRLRGRILHGQVIESDGEKADELRLEISNYDGRISKPRRGANLAVSLGFEETGIAKVGSFTVQSVVKIGASARFEITAHSADLKKKMKQQKSRSFVNKPLKDALQQIAGDNGLELKIDAALGSIVSHWYQVGVSDIHFVTETARKFGAIGKVADGKLIFVKRGTGESASGGAMSAIRVTPNDLEGDFRLADKDRPDRKKVKAKFYDRGKAAREDVVEEGEGEGPEYVFPQTYGSKAEATEAVKGRKREFDRAGKSFSGVFKTGLNSVKAGGILTTSGFGDDDHDWTLERVTHDFGEHGYVTRFEAKVKKGGGK